ncbi:MAG: flagellar basal body rod protein FlgB [Pirellulaceae bacterium]
MWDAWLNNSTLPALEQTAAFAQKRHALLAGNIANLDVPGYKTRDISVADFQEALSDAVEQQRNPSGSYNYVSGNSPSPISGMAAPSAMERVRDVSRQVILHDGSDVSLEEQVTEISKNQSMHDMSIALMRSQLQTMQVAIRESVSV